MRFTKTLTACMAMLFSMLWTVQSAAASAENKALAVQTSGVEHVGLAVFNLAQTQDFFIDALGFRLLGQNTAYPSAFLTDGITRITLWQVEEPKVATAFDRRQNIGLHHLAFKLETIDELHAMYARLKEWPDVKIEFAPELMGGGPSQHMMCYEPGGIRLEFTVR